MYYQISHPLIFEHLSEEWNSFSRVDISHKIIKQEDNNVLGNNNNNAVATPTTDTDRDSGRELASIIIDADAATPIFRWNGSQNDLAWIQKYMDYLPFKMINANNTLVIGQRVARIS